MTQRRRYKIAFVNTHPIQYFCPMYAWLQEYEDIDVTALYLSDLSLRGALDSGFDKKVKWDINLLEGYTSVFIGPASKTRTLGGFFSMTGIGLWPAIRSGNFDALVIHGHNFACHYVALAAARSSGTPVFIRAETHLGLTRPRWKQALREPLIRLLFSRFDGALAIGSANERYYRAMGVPNSRIFRVPYAIDNKRYCANGFDRSERQRVLPLYGLDPDRPVILYAAKFETRKRPSDLLSAFKQLRHRGIDAQLAMVGSGHLESQLKKDVKLDAMPDVVFPGFINQEALPALYAACDVFVLPSENEPWGLAVNEAMAAGLPIVLSREIACAEDLVTDGVNGYSFNCGDTRALTEGLARILADQKTRADMGAASRSRIETWSYRECGEGLRQAVESFFDRLI